MEEVYKEIRRHWYNLKRIDKPNTRTFGAEEIMIAGIEFKMFDRKARPVNIFVAANSLFESGFYYEKHTPEKMGHLLGRDNALFRKIISNFLEESAFQCYNMEEYKIVPRTPRLNFVNFFALGRMGRYYKTVTYNEVFCPTHPLHKIFIWATSLIDKIRDIKLQYLLREEKKLKTKIAKQKISINKEKRKINKVNTNKIDMVKFPKNTVKNSKKKSTKIKIRRKKSYK